MATPAAASPSPPVLINPTQWVVHKFGGTSVGSADAMRKCVNIIRPLLNEQRVAVVVSAIGGKPKVTDLLLDSVHAAASGNTIEADNKLAMILQKHKACVADVLSNSSDKAKEIISKIELDIRDIGDLLKAVTLMKMAHEQILELVSGYGEVWSATIMAALMVQESLPFVFLNARDVLLVSEDNLGTTTIYWEESEKKLSAFITNAEAFISTTDIGKNNAVINKAVTVPHLLITGYIASTRDGIATTLKRDGSDFSASIFGKMLKASGITIWTDVSGVYSADPRRVPEAQIIPEVSYTEAIELAYFGAKVIHPKTMAPAIMDSIPIFIRNTFAPDEGCTRIYLPPAKGEDLRERCVCGFSTVDNISLLNIEGTGMIGVPGIAHRLFGSLKNASISVMFIAQASSEHSICFATKESSTAAAKKAIEEAFFYELKQGLVTNIRVILGVSIIAAVGESMSNMPGVSGLFFGALGDARINVLSISQGCDERNISACIYTKDATKALRAVHAAFWLSSLDMNIGLVGTGRVGSALMQSWVDQIESLNYRFNINIKVRGIANSKQMLLGENLLPDLKKMLNRFKDKPQSPKRGDSTMRRIHSNIGLQDVESAFLEDDGKKVPVDLETFFLHVTSGGTPHSIMIDASTSEKVAARHPSWLKNGSHIVTANKRAISSSIDLYNSVLAESRKSGKLYMSEVTIGAALPVQTTINDLLVSGDSIHSIAGLMSVSVGMVLTDVCENGMMFSDALHRAYSQGLFEDDVFQDLEGTETAQKVLILARLLGVPLELNDVYYEPIAKKRHVTNWNDIESLRADFKEENEKLAKMAAAARAKDCTLRYIQRISISGHIAKACIKLEEVHVDSDYARVKGAVYHFTFYTERYSKNPLMIQGPLSDSANTASGIVGDMLRIAKDIGAKDKGPDLLTKAPLSRVNSLVTDSDNKA